MAFDTILRKAEHAALARLSVQGRVLDLGGGDSGYHELMRGAAEVFTVNMEPSAKPDLIADLEKPLALPDASFDTVLLMNVLEHIFEYRALLGECTRVTRPGGRVVILVPFLFPNHPSPDDFHRYTASALHRALATAGYAEIAVEPLGTGVFALRWALAERLLPRPLRWLSAIIVPCVRGMDRAFAAFARATGKKYQPADYALGFLATATKP